MQQPSAAPQEVLAGLVERATFHNEDSGFCVLRTKARGHRDVFCGGGDDGGLVGAGRLRPPGTRGSQIG